MLLKAIKQRGCETTVSFHKLRCFLRPVYTGGMNDKVRAFTVLIQLLRCAVNVVLVDGSDLQIRSCPVLSVASLCVAASPLFVSASCCMACRVLFLNRSGFLATLPHSHGGILNKNRGTRMGCLSVDRPSLNAVAFLSWKI